MGGPFGCLIADYGQMAGALTSGGEALPMSLSPTGPIDKAAHSAVYRPLRGGPFGGGLRQGKG